MLLAGSPAIGAVLGVSGALTARLPRSAFARTPSHNPRRPARGVGCYQPTSAFPHDPLQAIERRPHTDLACTPASSSPRPSLAPVHLTTPSACIERLPSVEPIRLAQRLTITSLLFLSPRLANGPRFFHLRMSIFLLIAPTNAAALSYRRKSSWPLTAATALPGH